MRLGRESERNERNHDQPETALTMQARPDDEVANIGCEVRHTEQHGTPRQESERRRESQRKSEGDSEAQQGRSAQGAATEEGARNGPKRTQRRDACLVERLKERGHRASEYTRPHQGLGANTY